jgi:hypothetical protein
MEALYISAIRQSLRDFLPVLLVVTGNGIS